MLNDSNPLTEIALHECSHAVIHHYFSHEIREVVVGNDDGHCQLAEQSVSAYDYIIGLCAGKAGMDRWYGCKSEEDQNWRESKDRKQAFAAALKASDGDTQAAELLTAWGQRMAEVLVDRPWPQIHKLAGAVIERGTLSGEQVTQILNGSNDEGHKAQVLE